MSELSREEMATAAARDVTGVAWYTFHTNGVLKTFTVSMKGSPDIMAARVMRKALGSDHYERQVNPEGDYGIIRKPVYHMETYETELTTCPVVAIVPDNDHWVDPEKAEIPTMPSAQPHNLPSSRYRP